MREIREYCNGVKGVIFDYGGTIDSRGEHWSEVIWRGWQDAGIICDRHTFREAYVHAERTLAKERHIMPEDDFYATMLKKGEIELEYYSTLEPSFQRSRIPGLAGQIAGYCDDAARKCVSEAIDSLIHPLMEAGMPMVLVSNFYGNVRSVLSAYGLDGYFKDVVESAVVGVRKPDPEIFRLGVRAMGFDSGEILVVGDSYRKDILPALEAGCRAVWIKGKGWTEDEDRQEYPYIIRRLVELKDCMLNKN